MQYIHILITGSLLVLAACGGAPPVPVDHFYRFTLPTDKIDVGRQITESVHVASFQADGVYNDRALLYSTDAGTRELQQYHYQFWMTSPANLLRDYLVEHLRNSGFASVVIADNNKKDGIRITGRVMAFEVLKTDTGNTAQVKVELSVYKPDHSLPLLVKTYMANETINGETVENIVEATNLATDRIYREFIGDASQLEIQ